MPISKEELHQRAVNVKIYRLIKPLDGYFSRYKNKAVGDKFTSEVLYESGYNINDLLEQGKIKEVPPIFPFEKDITGTNQHSVYSKCPECFGWGINGPLENVCGNCGYPKTIQYYDAETIQNFIDSLSQPK